MDARRAVRLVHVICVTHRQGSVAGTSAFYAGEMTLIVVTGVSSISEAAREGSIFIEVVED